MAKNKIELIVGLKIPDTTAITAFHTLEKMGFKELKKLRREDYYKFTVNEGFDKFSKKISKVDILVNANKNKFMVKSADEGFKEEETDLKIVRALVKDVSDGAKNLLSTLKTRLGFKQVSSMEKGVLWTLFLDADKEEASLIADKIAKSLLFNENYQHHTLLV